MKQSFDFAWFRKLSGYVFGIDQATVHFDIKNAFTFRYQPGINFKGGFDFCGHTGCIGLIISLIAVTNTDVHFPTPFTR